MGSNPAARHPGRFRAIVGCRVEGVKAEDRLDVGNIIREYVAVKKVAIVTDST